MSDQKQIEKKSQTWFEERINKRFLTRLFYWSCGLIILADVMFSLIWHKHAAFSEDSELHTLESFPAFYGAYGFVSCVVLVYISNVFRSWQGKKILMREETYWDN